MRAASLAAELNDAGHEASIEEGSKGQYDVVADGNVIFSKEREGRFPVAPELLEILA